MNPFPFLWRLPISIGSDGERENVQRDRQGRAEDLSRRSGLQRPPGTAAARADSAELLALRSRGGLLPGHELCRGTDLALLAERGGGFRRVLRANEGEELQGVVPTAHEEPSLEDGSARESDPFKAGLKAERAPNQSGAVRSAVAAELLCQRNANLLFRQVRKEGLFIFIQRSAFT